MKCTYYELEAPYQLATREQVIDIENIDDNGLFANTKYSAISTGTELAAWKGLPPLRPSKEYPRLVGYCNLAQVRKVGRNIKDIQVDDYIITHQSHRKGFICQQDDVLFKTNLTDQAMLKNLTSTYLYHLGYISLLGSNFQPGHQVAIIGMGVVGFATASLVKLYGIEPLIFTNQKSVDQNIIGRRVFKKEYPTSQEIEALTGIEGVDIVINTSNNWSDYLLGLKLARKGGQVICLGFPGRGEKMPVFNPLDSQYCYDKQLIIRHSGYVTENTVCPIDVRFTLKRNMAYLASLIVTGQIDPRHILSKEYSWKELDRAYDMLNSRKKGCFTAIIDWS